MFVFASCENEPQATTGIASQVATGTESQVTTETEPSVVSYYVNDDGNLISVFEDGNETNLGLWAESIVRSLKSVSISNDGFYVIDGVKTAIAVDYSTVALSSDGYYIINGVKTSIPVDFSTVAISDDGYYVIDGIKTDIVATSVYTVSFNPGFNTNLSEQFVKDGYTVTKPEVERAGYSLDGWFCNGEEWRFNSDVVKHDLVLTARWTANEYNVSFENSKGANPGDMVVTFGSNASLPNPSEVEGYSFDGWLNGNTLVSGSAWSIASDVTLTAKWTAKKYTITLNAGGGSVSQSSKTVTYDQGFTLPIPTNNYGVFTGWLYNGEPITDSSGKSLVNWSLAENITATVDWTIKIYTPADLQKLGTYLNGEFVLMNDIDMDGVAWTPVGTNSKPFTGVLNGNGHSINHLTIDTSSCSNLSSFGLFGNISNADISNIIFSGFEFRSDNLSKAYSVGVVAGVDLSNDAELQEGDYTLSNVSVSGQFNITKQSSSYPVTAGGLIGKATIGYYNNCTNSISITNAMDAGGIVGSSSQLVYVISCGNNGLISSSSYAGGIVGKTNYGIWAKMCYNEGAVSSVQAAGGIVGLGGIVGEYEYCCNAGAISSTADTNFTGSGGLVGSTSSDGSTGLTIRNCYNKGSISAASYAGGLCGSAIGNITIVNVYNIGSVSGHLYSGNIFALGMEGNVKQCLGAGNVTAATIRSSIGYPLTSVVYSDCFYVSSSSFTRTDGTSTSNVYGKALYVDDMFWKEYNPSTGKGDWVFHENDYPTLFWES